MLEPNPHHDMVRRLFGELLEVPKERRAQVLAERCGDPAVRKEVEELLSFERRESDLVDGLAPGAERPLEALPTVAGYRLLQEIGDGSSGRVYEAVPDAGGDSVAIKVLRAMEANDPRLELFAREARVLERLEHPGIARLIGVAEASGSQGIAPCVIMDLVDGQPISAHCDAFDLDDEQRIGLVADLCDAVQHAHERGVVHRDIKPANVLVNARGRAVLVDFGVARLSGVDDLETLAKTHHGDLLGTLAYMSPEQAGGRAQGVDGRSDVYSLGVLLFRLLTGRLPLRLAGVSLTDALRIIEHEEPRSLLEARPESDVDLSAIAARALEKERGDRYGSAAALGQDLRRYLAEEAIQAKLPGTMEQLRRFARRNRLFVGLVAGLILALFLGLAGIGYGLLEAQAREVLAKEGEQEALRVGKETENLVGALLEVLEAPTREAQGYQVRVSELLDDLGEQLIAAEGVAPAVAARLHHQLGETYSSLGLVRQSVEHLELALAACDVVPKGKASGAVDLGDLLLSLGSQLRQSGRLDRSRTILQRGRATRAATHGAEHPLTWEFDAEIAFTLRLEGAYEEAASMADQAHRKLVEALPTDASPVHRAAHILAGTQFELGDFVLATKLQWAALKGFELQPEKNLVAIQHARASLAQLYRVQGQNGEAIELYRQAYARSIEMHGEEHVTTYHVQEGLGIALQRHNEHNEALVHLTAAAKGFAALYDPEHDQNVVAQGSVAQVLFDLGRRSEALEIMEPLVEGLASREQSRSNVAMRAFNLYGSFLYRSGELKDASGWMEKGVSIARELHGPLDHQRLVLEANLAQVLFRAGQVELSEVRQLELLQRLESSDLQGTAQEMQFLANYGWLLTNTDRAHEGVSYLERAKFLIDQYYQVGSHPHTTVHRQLGEALLRDGQREAARATLVLARASAAASEADNEELAGHIESLLDELEQAPEPLEAGSGR